MEFTVARRAEEVFELCFGYGGDCIEEGAVGEGAQVEGPQAILEAAGLVVAPQLRASANTALRSKVIGYTVPETPVPETQPRFWPIWGGPIHKMKNEPIGSMK